MPGVQPEQLVAGQGSRWEGGIGSESPPSRLLDPTFAPAAAELLLSFLLPSGAAPLVPSLGSSIDRYRLLNAAPCRRLDPFVVVSCISYAIGGSVEAKSPKNETLARGRESLPWVFFFVAA